MSVRRASNTHTHTRTHTHRISVCEGNCDCSARFQAEVQGKTYPHTWGASTDCCFVFIWLVSTHPRDLHGLVLCSYDWIVEILWSRWPGVTVFRSPDSETLISVKVFVNVLLILALFSSFSGSSGSDSVWLMYIFHNSRHFCEQLSQTCLSSC